MKNINIQISIWHRMPEWNNESLYDFLEMPETEYIKWVRGRMTPEELANYGYEE